MDVDADGKQYEMLKIDMDRAQSTKWLDGYMHT